MTGQHQRGDQHHGAEHDQRDDEGANGILHAGTRDTDRLVRRPAHGVELASDVLDGAGFHGESGGRPLLQLGGAGCE
ncbi:MAG: hypothetical protein ACR2HP_07770 [Ilumatobacteraceae bacterium]